MRRSFIRGGSFGLTSAIITTLGLMVGLYSCPHSRLAVIGGIAKRQQTEPWKAVGEHFLIGTIVVATNHFVGTWVAILHP